MRLVAMCAVVTLWVLPAYAEDRIDRLAQAMNLSKYMEILASEGDTQRLELDETLLDNTGGAFFEAQVADIYDTVWMQAQITEALARGLTETQLDQAALFFESDLGQTIVALEYSARQAFSDQAIEDLARDSYRGVARDSMRFELVKEYIEVNDLIDQNVQGALSYDYNFFKGLDHNSIRDDADLLAELLEQQDSMTVETTTWLYSFLLMAYSPLDEAQMRENIAFSRTETGQALNAALFDGFDRMFDGISYRLGAAVAQVLQGSDL